MTAVLISASAVLAVIVLFCLPFNVNSHTAVSIGKLFVIENLNLLGVLTLTFSLRIEDGKLIRNGKPLKRKPKNNAKKHGGLDPAAILMDFNVRKVEVRGVFGNVGDAAATALITSSIVTIIKVIENTIFKEIPKFSVNFFPLYQRNTLEFDAKIYARINVFMIISFALKILFRKR